jgi:hypothetical protein
MQALLANPAFQGAVAPFLVALMLAWPLRRRWPLGQGLALMAGLLMTVWLTTGLSFQPLTSTRKIILCSLLIPLSAPLLSMLGRQVSLRWLPALLTSVILAVAAVWVAWPVLHRQEGWALWAMAGQVIAYAAVIGGSILCLLPAPTTHGDAHQPFAQQGGAILALALGTGAASVIGASALYGQLAFALAAATGALLLAALILHKREAPMEGLHPMALLAAALPLGLLGAAASIYAKLPVAALLFLAFVPIIVRLPVITAPNLWLRLALTTLLAAVPLIPALWLTWRAAGPISF